MADDPLTPDIDDRPTVRNASTVDAPRAVMFAQIDGAASLYESLGDARALALVTRALFALEQQVYEHRGTVIKTVGQGMLCLFRDVSAAMHAAIAMQQRMEHFAAESAVTLGLRVGFRSGPIIEEQGDVFGDAVNVAARLVNLASAGQIITDADTLSCVRSALRRRTRAIDRRRLKGRSAELHIVEVGWQRHSGDPTTTDQGLPLDPARSAVMRLRHQGRAWRVDAARATFTLGRDEANDLSVKSAKVSRQHARIEWRRDKFVLFDHSTNGTYVTPADKAEVLVKHESFLLHGQGLLSVGEPARDGGVGVVEYDCR